MAHRKKKKYKLHFLNDLDSLEYQTFSEILKYAEDKGLYHDLLYKLEYFIQDYEKVIIKSSLQELRELIDNGEKSREFYISNVANFWLKFHEKPKS